MKLVKFWYNPDILVRKDKIQEATTFLESKGYVLTTAAVIGMKSVARFVCRRNGTFSYAPHRVDDNFSNRPSIVYSTNILSNPSFDGHRILSLMLRERLVVFDGVAYGSSSTIANLTLGSLYAK